MGYAKPQCPVLQDGDPLVAAGAPTLALPLNEGSGTTLNDLSLNGNGGTLNSGAAWIGGTYGSAVSCSGGGYIAVTLGTGPPSFEDYSLALNFFPVTWTGGFTALIDDTGRVWSLFIDTSGNISFTGGVFAGAAGLATGMTAGNPWQIVLTRLHDSTTSCYVNGKLIGTFTSTTGLTKITSHFGDNPSGGGTNFNGFYESLLFFPRALSSAEVAALAFDAFRIYRRRGWRLKKAVVAGQVPWTWVPTLGPVLAQ